MKDLPYPQRAQSHIQERQSREIFGRCLPDHWIIRELSERDYGIDALIEIVHPDNTLRGEIVSIQLKSLDATITWDTSGFTKKSGIKCSTGAYWLSFAVPVYLCLVDLNTSEVYYANARKQVRLQYSKLTTQDTLSFFFSIGSVLNKETAVEKFYTDFKLERDYQLQLGRVFDLLLHYRQYREVLEGNIGKDFHLAPEPDEVAIMYHVCILVGTALQYLGERQLPMPFDKYAEENAAYCENTGYRTEYYFFAENISIWLLAGMAYTLPRLSKRVLLEQAYWKETDFLMWRLVRSELDASLKDWCNYLYSNPLVDLFMSKENPSSEEFFEACDKFSQSELQRIIGKLDDWSKHREKP